MKKVSTIKTFEEACTALGLNPDDQPDVSKLPEKHQKAITAHYKLVVITEALNEGWQPDWNDPSQRKYYPWFYVKATAKKPSGSGLSYGDCADWATYTTIGSRLCFKSSELAEYAGKKFKSYYEEYFLLN